MESDEESYASTSSGYSDGEASPPIKRHSQAFAPYLKRQESRRGPEVDGAHESDDDMEEEDEEDIILRERDEVLDDLCQVLRKRAPDRAIMQFASGLEEALGQRVHKACEKDKSLTFLDKYRSMRQNLLHRLRYDRSDIRAVLIKAMDNQNPEDGYASLLNRYCSKSKNRLKVEAKNRTKETPGRVHPSASGDSGMSSDGSRGGGGSLSRNNAMTPPVERPITATVTKAKASPIVSNGKAPLTNGKASTSAWGAGLVKRGLGVGTNGKMTGNKRPLSQASSPASAHVDSDDEDAPLTALIAAKAGSKRSKTISPATAVEKTKAATPPSAPPPRRLPASVHPSLQNGMAAEGLNGTASVKQEALMAVKASASGAPPSLHAASPTTTTSVSSSVSSPPTVKPLTNGFVKHETPAVSLNGHDSLCVAKVVAVNGTTAASFTVTAADAGSGGGTIGVTSVVVASSSAVSVAAPAAAKPLKGQALKKWRQERMEQEMKAKAQKLLERQRKEREEMEEARRREEEARRKDIDMRRQADRERRAKFVRHVTFDDDRMLVEEFTKLGYNLFATNLTPRELAL